MQLISAAGRLNPWQPMLPSLDARQSSEQVGRHAAFSSWSTNWRSRASKSSLAFAAAAALHYVAARPSIDGCNALPIAETLCSLQKLSLLVGDPCMSLRTAARLLSWYPCSAALPNLMDAFTQEMAVAVNNE